MSLPILLDVIKDIIIFELFTLDIILFPPPLVGKDCEAVKHELLVSSVLQFFPRIMYYVCLAVRATVKPNVSKHYPSCSSIGGGGPTPCYVVK